MTAEVDGLIERLGNLLAADSTDKCLIRVTNGDVRAAIYGLRRLQRELQEQQRVVEGLREALEGIAWLPGAWEAISHIEYCRFCSYSRQWVESNGHGNTCPLFVPPDAAIKEKQV